MPLAVAVALFVDANVAMFLFVDEYAAAVSLFMAMLLFVNDYAAVYLFLFVAVSLFANDYVTVYFFLFVAMAMAVSIFVAVGQANNSMPGALMTVMATMTTTISHAYVLMMVFLAGVCVDLEVHRDRLW